MSTFTSKWMYTLILTGFLSVFSTPSLALDPVNASFFGKAIKGYDPVAYFAQGRAVEGSGDYRSEWNGASWYFSTADNLAAFSANPEKYAPQYGGYCAWAVSQGYTANIDPEAWTINEGKLYLNYSKSVRQQWAQDIPGNIARGDANWPRLLADN